MVVYVKNLGKEISGIFVYFVFAGILIKISLAESKTESKGR